jgi:hypothetical protein
MLSHIRHGRFAEAMHGFNDLPFALSQLQWSFFHIYACQKVPAY